MKKIIATLGIVGALGGGIFVASMISIEEITLENPKVITWQRPTSDEQWAEDIKAEGFDRYSSDILEEIIADKKQALDELLSGQTVFTNCEECQIYIGVGEKDYIEEKLKQSIERMSKELELRSRDFVKPNKIDRTGTPARKSDLENIDEKFIRDVTKTTLPEDPRI